MLVASHPGQLLRGVKRMSPHQHPNFDGCVGTDEDDDHSTTSSASISSTPSLTMVGTPCAAVAAATHLSPNEWTDVVQKVIQFLTVDEFQNLRLVGNKEMNLSDPSLTCHLQLRMDKAPFFTSNSKMEEGRIKKWLAQRERLVINDVNANTMCPYQVEYLVNQGYLDSVTELVVLDCHAHHDILSKMAHLPNLKSLMLTSSAQGGSGDDQEQQVLDGLESTIASLGNMPTSLKHLDIEFDCTINGSRLSFLRKLSRLETLRLRGFDLSDGLPYLKGLRSLHALHLCHGNFFSSPSNDINEKDLLTLMDLVNLKYVHLEGFDCLSSIGLEPFCTAPTAIERLVLKHCQELNENCLPSIGRMEYLTSLHLVHSECDDTLILGRESLHQLNALTSLKSLSLFYVLDDIADLEELSSLTSLETLNIALEDGVDMNDLCRYVLPIFSSTLRTLRVFSEDGERSTHHAGQLKIECGCSTLGICCILNNGQLKESK